MGGDAYHNLPEHYEAIAGLFAGPAGCNIVVIDDLPSQTHATLSGYDLIVLWTTMGKGPPEAIGALFDVVREGTPLIGLHAAHTPFGWSRVAQRRLDVRISRGFRTSHIRQ